MPKLYWYGTEGDYNIMAMDILGSNLEELMKELGGQFSMVSTLLVADQMVISSLNHIKVFIAEEDWIHAYS